MTEQTRDPRFFSTINRSALAINQSAAGAGLTGLLGFVLLFVVAAIFFITDERRSFVSSAPVTYTSSANEIVTIETIFFSSKHLTPQAGQLQETLVALQSALEFRRDDSGQVMVGAVEQGSKVRLPDNTLARDIQEVVEKEKNVEYADYVAHTYYVECHELYDYSAAHFEFVSGAMPLFGLIGTIVGLIAMFDSLGGDVSVEALSPQLALALKTTLYGAVLSSVYRIIGSRFEQRLKSLDYDVETFTRALQVVIENRVKVEVQ